MNLTGIILAGGKSTRMGTDKGMMFFNGKKLVEYPLDMLRRICNELIISSDNPEYSVFDARIIQDKVPDKGPVSGLASSLLESTNEWNLVLGCDMPFLNMELIEMLIYHSGPEMGIVPGHDRFYEPIAALYHRSMGETFAKELHQGNYSLQAILRSANVKFLPVDSLLVEFPQLFKNINTAEDLKISSVQNP